jgi:hypothetical protein
VRPATWLDRLKAHGSRRRTTLPIRASTCSGSDGLRRWADDELRSVNGQIEFLLRRALRDAGRLEENEGREDAGK